ncbi:hypothetical protein [Pseudophaeobacter leonis]|nr:hypothetical protein [Pseudophaeobacter leonis]
MSYLGFGQDVIADFGDGDRLDLMSYGGARPAAGQLCQRPPAPPWGWHRL